MKPVPPRPLGQAEPFREPDLRLRQAPGPSGSPVLTLFTVPKPFKGHTGVIQRNAIRSWTLLRPACEIVLFGDEEGTRDAATELGCAHVPEVARNEHGTPLVDDLFARAERLGRGGLLCYVNADIILMNDFVLAARRVARLKARFLMVGRRRDVDLNEPWDFARSDWALRLRSYVHERGRLHPKTGIDYFVYRPGLFGRIPPFALGRTCWDNWLVFRALRRLATVVDATAVATAVHQNHDYGKLGTKEEVWDSVEARQNRGLMPGRTFTLDDATHVLLPGATSGAGPVRPAPPGPPRPNGRGSYLRPPVGRSRRAGDTSRFARLAWRVGRTPHWLRRLTDLFSSTRLPVGALFRFVEATRPLREGLGLTLSALAKEEL